jgi:PAS domain S-box-containing protein
MARGTIPYEPPVLNDSRVHDERDRRVLEAAEHGVWAVDATDFTDYINARGAEILGYAAGEMLGRSPFAFVSGEHAAKVVTALKGCRQGSRERGELRIRRKDGSEAWIQFAANPIFGSAGDYQGAVAVFTDITGIRAIAGEAQQIARELQDFYRNAPCGYHSLDHSGIITRMNDTELGWLGYSRDEVVGTMHFADLLPAPLSRQLRQDFALPGERLRNGEYEMQRKDGTVFPVLLHSTAVKDANGQFVRSHASVWDLGPRRRAEHDLRESELRNTAILRTALDCIVSIDDQGTILEFNPAAQSTFGYTRQQAVGTNVSDLIIPPAMREAHRQGLQRYMTTGATALLGKRVQVTAMRSDGSEFPVELTVTSVQLRDHIIFTAYLRDITREKWAEQELRRYADDLRAVSQRLVQVQEAERRMLANALHDLVGQKLTALNLNLNIVKSQLHSPDLVPAVEARLDDSLSLVELTVESIRDVMTELRPAVLDDYGLTPVLRWYAEQFAKRTGIATSVIEQGAFPRLPANAEEAFFRIVQEALANVAKYAGAGKATVTLGNAPQTIRLTIADDGCGFDQAARRAPARDHGWGLMIMQERAAAVGARLNVLSTPGGGTQVVVTLEGPAT